MSLEIRGGWSQRELVSSSRGGLCSVFFCVCLLFMTLAWALRTMCVCGARALETMNHGNVVVVQMQPIATVSQLSNMFCWFVGVVDGGWRGVLIHPHARIRRWKFRCVHCGVANCTIHKIMNLAICKVTAVMNLADCNVHESMVS